MVWISPTRSGLLVQAEQRFSFLEGGSDVLVGGRRVERDVRQACIVCCVYSVQIIACFSAFSIECHKKDKKNHFNTAIQ